jgi:hypothetical protein
MDNPELYLRKADAEVQGNERSEAAMQAASSVVRLLRDSLCWKKV